MTAPVLVVGAALMDLKATSRQPIVARTSNPATLLTSPGGVGRNIAENLARLGSSARLVAIVGPDAFGETILDGLTGCGVGTDGVITGPAPTGTYLAVLDADGELSVALSDVSATEGLSAAEAMSAAGDLSGMAYLVLDGNLPRAVLAALLSAAAEAGVPVVLEPVSVPKALRVLPLLEAASPISVLTPNVDEVAALTGLAEPPDRDDLAALAAAAMTLHGVGVETVWIRRGGAGSLVSTRTADGNVATADVPGTPTRVVDVTGAGDAMTAGFVHARLCGATIPEAAAYGQVCAALTVASPHTVRPDLTDALVRERLTKE